MAISNITKQNIVNTRQADNDKPYTLADMARDIFYDYFIGKKKPLSPFEAVPLT